MHVEVTEDFFFQNKRKKIVFHSNMKYAAITLQTADVTIAVHNK
jgi:hypothetical protein